MRLEIVAVIYHSTIDVPLYDIKNTINDDKCFSTVIHGSFPRKSRGFPNACNVF